MSSNPFSADPAIPERLAALGEHARQSVQAAIQDYLQKAHFDAAENDGGVLPNALAEELIVRFGLSSIRELMLLLLDVAQQYAAPAISDFHVGAVGLEAETGNLILGGNVEFPGTHLGYTLHGEGFVFTRAMSRGTNISVIAIGEAHPCAHCRQCLAEYAASDGLELIDPLGHTLTMAQLYPWPFDPAYLGERGAVPGRALWPNLTPAGDQDKVPAPLLRAGALSHSPYSKCPAAVVLTMRDGAQYAGFAIESVAFNPTIQPLQMAMVNLLAHGQSAHDIVSVDLGTVSGGDVDYSRSTQELLGAIAPSAALRIYGWSI
ncbi:hypothetical protein [Devosia sp. XK-2]|uniref:hypothetical protein n=1 Tax=Devosia sp. XK-2 TaxID=3126689 RepID=UPI0030D5C62D